MSEEDLNGSEQFLLITAAITAFGACIAMTYQFVLRSRCTSIKCCGIECERSVIDLQANDLELNNRAAN